MRSTFGPDDAARLLAGVRAPWWVAGGWALELFLGRRMREHEDLDVAILRRDFEEFRAALGGWDFRLGPDLVPLAPGVAVPADRHAVWCRPSPAAAWAFELLLNEADGDEWVFRRHPAVRLPFRAVGSRTPSGIPFLAPEVVLLYKAKAQRPTDEADLTATWPALDARARAFLRTSLAVAHPGHPWMARLA